MILEHTPPIPAILSPVGKEFLGLCFKRNPDERPTAQELLEHPFVKYHATVVTNPTYY